MTETLTHVAVREINGIGSDCFEALPGVTFSQNDANCFVIDAPHVVSSEVVTNDVVQLIDSKHFTLQGRADCVINTGGVKVQAEVIEAKLSAYLSVPYAVFGLPDERLGQKVTLVIEGEKSDFNFEWLFHKAALTKFELPRLVIECEKLPLTDSGKIKRSELVNLRRES
jgi:O-succinylbenzoic acid--CoA ligase